MLRGQKVTARPYVCWRGRRWASMMCTDIGLPLAVLGGDKESAAKGYFGSEKRRS